MAYEKRRGRLTTIQPRVSRLDTRKAVPPPKTVDSFYHSAEWRALISSIVDERGRICEDPLCEKPDGPWSRIYGDHIKELRDGGEPLDAANILLRCSPCHGRKTAQERAKRMRS